jgi:RND family efflux transporter MFP subunit
MHMRLWCLALLLCVCACEKKETSQAVRPVKTLLVSTVSSSTHQIIFPGTLRAFKRADLAFRVDGLVIMRDIYVGYRAHKDQTLVQLDPREYEIALQKSKGKVESTQAQLNFAERDYDRMKKIFERDPGAISASLVDRKGETVNQLKAELTIAVSDFDKASDDLSYTALKAPYDGIVAAIYVENHEPVRAKQMVLRFLDLTDREMEINVPEKYVNGLLEGRDRLNFDVRLDAFPDVIFNASITEIGTEAASTTQTYPVTLSLQNVPVELSLLAGMSGRAFLSQSTEHFDNTFEIPKSAIFSENGQNTYVWVVDPHTQTVHKQAIKIDTRTKGNQVIVQEGLNSGERIVIAGTSFLVEGQKVKLDAEPTEP